MNLRCSKLIGSTQRQLQANTAQTLFAITWGRSTHELTTVSITSD